MLNINYGRNAELMKQSHTLREYAQYVALVRRYKTELGSLDEAVNRAVDECIRNGVLADFLRRNRAEVVMMSIFEYNQEEEERKLRAAERQAWYASGVEHGIKQGMAQGIERGTAARLSRTIQTSGLTASHQHILLHILRTERFPRKRQIRSESLLRTHNYSIVWLVISC